jgi:hypothetical protein
MTFQYYAVADYRTLVVDHGLLVDVHNDPGVSTYLSDSETTVNPFREVMEPR